MWPAVQAIGYTRARVAVCVQYSQDKKGPEDMTVFRPFAVAEAVLYGGPFSFTCQPCPTAFR